MQSEYNVIIGRVSRLAAITHCWWKRGPVLGSPITTSGTKNITIKQPIMERRNFCNPGYANVYNAGLPQGDTRANGASGHSLHPTLRTTSR